MTTSKDDVVIVVRGDGKEFTIKRSMVAEHVNRGFKVKNAKDQPTEEELKKAVGFDLKKPADAAPTAAVPEENDTEKPLDKLTVAQLQEKAVGLGLNVPNSAKKADLVKLIASAPEFGKGDSGEAKDND